MTHPSPSSSSQELRKLILLVPGPFTPSTILSLLAARLRQQGHDIVLRTMQDLDRLTEEQLLQARELLPEVTGTSLPTSELAEIIQMRRAANQ